MAEKTDREIIEETARIARKLATRVKFLFAWILGMVFLLFAFEMRPLLLGENVAYPEYDSAIRLMLLLMWTASVSYLTYLAEMGKEN